MVRMMMEELKERKEERCLYNRKNCNKGKKDNYQTRIKNTIHENVMEYLKFSIIE